MSNHYHLVLHVDTQQADSWGEDEVIKRWTTLFPANGRLIETLRLNAETKVARQEFSNKIALWRERLQDISWFMRCLNETVARQANREDECTGRFWEGRFKSQALLDEKALVTCMAYVDLNPIRAGITDSLESSDFTSIQERLIDHARKVRKRSYRQQRLLHRRNVQHLLDQPRQRKGRLLSLQNAPGIAGQQIPVTRSSYISLLEETTRALQLQRSSPARAEQSFVDKHEALIELGISPTAWLEGVQKFNRYYGAAAGTEESLSRFQRHRINAGAELKHENKWIRGIAPARRLYGT